MAEDASAAVLLNNAKRYFSTHATKSLKWRKAQLEAVRKMVVECQDEIKEAVFKDLHRPEFEALVGEAFSVVSEIDLFLANLDDWAAPETVTTPAVLQPASCSVIREPKGVVLVLGAWNFPTVLSLLPTVAALAAGNCVILKPSELAAHSAELVASIIPKYLDPQAVQVVTGGPDLAKELTSLPFDHMFYTGGGSVARHVMASAAQNLVPVTLELGGKSPCIVTKTASLHLTAKRILSGKFLNAGQVCIAPDFVLCEPEVEDKLVEEMVKVLRTFYGPEPKDSKDFGRIINRGHWKRLKHLLDTHGGETVVGGDVDASERYLAPTLLRNIDLASPIMEQEIFGPILPIVSASLDEAIGYVNGRDKPLALYVFAEDQPTINRVLAETSSGAVCVNETVLHHANPHLPFGGIGESGMGSYHGRHGFETFSHKKAVLSKSCNTLIDPPMRYPPYSKRSLNIISWIVLTRFPRVGSTTKKVAFVLGLLATLFWILRRRR